MRKRIVQTGDALRLRSEKADTMIDQDQAMQLHDRVTRGLELSMEEQAALAAWYAQQDQAESASLAGKPASELVEELRAQIDATLSRLRQVTEQIEAQVSENERLRRDNAVLQQELTETRAAPRA
jgi:uncharacterized protein YPO0396